jgi:C-methyltransferase C-terminal domain
MKLSNRRQQNEKSVSLKHRLKKEIEDGITNDIFPTIFQTQAQLIKKWIKSEIHHFLGKQFVIGVYGAAAKGMVLLHYMLPAESLKQSKYISFVLDDAPLKQKTFCPGTVIPIISTEQLPAMDTSENLAIVVLA